MEAATAQSEWQCMCAACGTAPSALCVRTAIHHRLHDRRRCRFIANTLPQRLGQLLKQVRTPRLPPDASPPHASSSTPSLVPNLAYVFEQAAAQQPVTADDVIAASITQLFYELDVEMIKATGTLSGCCCVAAAYAAPLMIVVSCGDCRSLFSVVWIGRVAVTFRGAGPSSAAWTTSATA